MIRMRTHIFLALLACGLATPLAAAQSPDLAEQLAPCLSAETVLVARLDVARLDIEAVARMAIETAASTMSRDQVDQLKAAIDRHRRSWQQRATQFKEAGGESLFLILNLSEMYLAVPRTSRLDEAAIKAWFEGLEGQSLNCRRKDGLLVAAHSWVFERRKDQAPVRRMELRQAAAKSTGAGVEVFLIPSADARRVLEAMLPTMLGADFALQHGALVRGLQWATIGIDLPPTPALKVHIESADAVSAGACQGFVAKILTMTAQLPALKEAYPNVQALVALLTPQINGTALRLAFDAKQTTQLAGQVLTPGLFALQKSIARQQCTATLNGMGKALLIYANDYEDKWPPSLETLVKYAEYPRSGLVCPAMRHRPDYESYVYRGVDTGGTSVEPMIIMVHDRAGNHEGGRNILFVDTHVEWVSEERFQELIAQDNALRRKRGLAEKPAP